MTTTERHATLTFPDGESLLDLSTFAARARVHDQGGAIRLQAVGEVLAAWVCVLPGRDLLGSGTVLGLRTMPLAGAHQLDTTVPLAGLADRFARRAATGDSAPVLTVPPTTVSPPWGGVTPPRGGWAPVGRLAGAELAQAAREGVAEVAQGAPATAGAPAVAALRARVWGRLLSHDVPAGVALATLALGFVHPDRGQEATVHRSGPWVRVSLPAGHVLAR